MPPTMNKDQIFEKALDAVRKIQNNNGFSLKILPSMASNLDVDIGFDSLLRVELFGDIERSCNITFLDSDIVEIDTFGDLVNTVYRKLEEQASVAQG